MKGLWILWLSGYHSPGKMAELIKELPSPIPGFVAVLLRGLINSLLLFLPLYLLGRQPTMPGYLSFVATEDYFLFPYCTTNFPRIRLPSIVVI